MLPFGDSATKQITVPIGSSFEFSYFWGAHVEGNGIATAFAEFTEAELSIAVSSIDNPSYEVPSGTSSMAQTNGGASNLGGMDVTFDNVSSGGTLTATYLSPLQGDLSTQLEQIASGASDITFVLIGEPTQL